MRPSVRSEMLFEPRRLLVLLIALSALIFLFVSVGGGILVSCLVYPAATILHYDRQSGAWRVRLRTRRFWHLALMALVSAVLLAFAAVALVEAPRGAVWY